MPFSSLSKGASVFIVLAIVGLRGVTAQQNFTSLPTWVCGLVPTICGSKKCQAVSPLSADKFDLDQYIEKTWYVQKQQVTPYQSENDLYCVTATYAKKSNGLIDVRNYANSGGVNGNIMGSSNNGTIFSNLCAKQVDGGSLKVAPCLLGLGPDLVGGPYWVLDVGGNYSWALISGGQPDQVKQEQPKVLCTTKEGRCFLDVNGSGLWLFTRERFPADSLIQAMEARLVEMGIWTGDLLDVVQEGCNYVGDNRKE